MAWAEGKNIQYGYNGVWQDYDQHGSPEFNLGLIEWRIKPRQFCLYHREALAINPLSGRHYYTITVSSSDIDTMLIRETLEEEQEVFVRWINDRQCESV